MQKAILVALLLVAVVSVANAKVASLRYNGQDIYAEPNCAIVTDHTHKFRDISDPTFYWICPKGQEKASYIQCPPNEAFIEQDQKCVTWDQWRWVEPYTK